MEIPEISERIFNYLENDDLINCRLVCKTWKSALDEPMFWLIKLKSIGHSEESHNQWLELIQISTENGKPKQILGFSLMVKFFTILKETRVVWKNVYSNFPPMYFATKYGQIEVVKVLHQTDKNCCKKPISCLPGDNIDYMPLILAIKNHQCEVVKFMVENVEVSNY